jgi:hypothetical protein
VQPVEIVRRQALAPGEDGDLEPPSSQGPQLRGRRGLHELNLETGVVGEQPCDGAWQQRCRCRGEPSDDQPAGCTIRRGIIVAEGEYIACQTWIEGTFVRAFTQSPAGRLEPTGAHAVMDLMTIFRFDELGRLVEEYVRTDYRSFLQLGTERVPDP